MHFPNVTVFFTELRVLFDGHERALKARFQRWRQQTGLPVVTLRKSWLKKKSSKLMHWKVSTVCCVYMSCSWDRSAVVQTGAFQVFQFNLNSFQNNTTTFWKTLLSHSVEISAPRCLHDKQFNSGNSAPISQIIYKSNLSNHFQTHNCCWTAHNLPTSQRSNNVYK